MQTILFILNVAGGMVAAVFAVMCFELLRVIAGRKESVTAATLLARIAELDPAPTPSTPPPPSRGK